MAKEINIGDFGFYREIDFLIWEVMDKDDFGNYYLITIDTFGPFGDWVWDIKEFKKMGTL